MNKKPHTPARKRLGVLYYAKKINPDFSGVRVGKRMRAVLFRLEQGQTMEEACKAEGIARTEPEIWALENKLFASCVEILTKVRASDVRESMILRAKDDTLAGMFVTKAHYPEYSEKAQQTKQVRSILRVTSNGKAVAIEASYEDGTLPPERDYMIDLAGTDEG